MPVGDYPILEILIRQLARCGIDNIVLTIGYHYELFQAFFRDGKKWGVNLEYSLENKPLGTIGPLKLIKNLDENFLVINGDTLTDLDYKSLYDLHIRKKNFMTITAKRRSVHIDYGVIKHERTNIINYDEKPALKYIVAMGVNVLSKKVLNIIPDGKRYDFPDLVQELIKQKTAIRCYVHDGYWLDIGRPDDYKIAVKEFQKDQKKFLGENNSK